MLVSFVEVPSQAPAPILSVKKLTKRFPGVVANDSIDLNVFAGEVHALLGENGAGKSTLVKCIYGYYQRDEGEILIRGESAEIASPNDARRCQIGMVFQDFNLIPALSLVENISLFLPELSPVPDLKLIAEEIADLGARYHLEVDPWALAQDLSIGQQQKAELLKLLLAKARIIILDEPTRVLAPHELDGFFQVLERLKDDDFAVILITHKLNEVLQCADRITVLRGGRIAGTVLREDASEEMLVRMMFEKELASFPVEHRQDERGESQPILELIGVSTQAVGAETSLAQIDLVINESEIVGVAGVSGNGQRELGDLILGMINCSAGRKLLYGRDVTQDSIRKLRHSGVSFVPENPLTMAAVPFMTVLENMAVPYAHRYSRFQGLQMDWDSVKFDTEASMARLGFQFPLYMPSRALSGGNLQRMVIVRDMTHSPRLIIASYLTRGLDVQSARAARRALLQARDGGAGVLLISEDLEELFNLSDRLIVMQGGKIMGEFAPGETDIYEVGHLMTGFKGDHVAIK
jgi:ABC-type uncharacterized transport system ATPase subunit